ncbi:CLCA_X family protein [Pseudoalteromonas sp. T1lg65]|uniref:CLCA_X family protein n=1 Tax=Pseudoalteromonas sp. T1lg65 TaxID=2077101 RepID=UPI003F79B271
MKKSEFSRLKQKFIRTGPDYRFGDQVCFEEIKQTFGFKTMTIGAWVSTEEKHLAANLIYDALADLAQILSIPPTTIGLRNTLNFAFGSGGQKGVQAHYDSSSRTLALAKNAGAGALAHEWWHAFDHHITKHLFVAPSKAFASSAWLTTEQLNPHAINAHLADFYAATLLSPDGDRCSNFFNQARALDASRGSFYYARPEELTARMFETIVAFDDEIKNTFLVDDVLRSNSVLGLYPTIQQRIEAAQAIKCYFNLLGKLLYRQLESPLTPTADIRHN